MQADASLAGAARYRHPREGMGGRLVEWLVGSGRWRRLRRWLTARVPVPALASDVRDVVYLSWWADPASLPPAPAGYRYWQRGGRTPFTILTYRHGHFGPALLGPVRRLLPSPLQSNWRWYLQRVDAPEGRMPTVLFARNVMDGPAHVVGARLWSDAMQPHLAAMRHGYAGGVWTTRIEPGHGSAPAFASTLKPAAGGGEDGEDGGWCGRFASRAEAVRFLACQDEAIAVAPDGRLAATTISLPVDLSTLRMLDAVEVHCPLLAGMRADPRNAFCFLLPRVPFQVVSERLL